MRRLLAQFDRVRRRHDTLGWLWLCVGAVGLFTIAAIAMNALQPAGQATTRGDLGHDFLAFYSAGRMVDTGHADSLYDLAALERVQHSIAATDNIDNVAPPVAPWWNPPHVALLFAPLSRLGFYPALALFSAIGLGCLATSAYFLKTTLHGVGASRRARLLIPATLIAAPATLQALGHGQNTFISLLLVTLTVVAWRRRSPIVAGLLCALLFYKPQLAMILALALVGTLGWRVCVGLMLGLVPQALACVTLLPGAFAAFFANVPANLHRIQQEQPYLWHRHTTFTGFWHFLLQGNAPGATSIAVTLLSLACVATIGGALILCWWRLRPLINAEDDVALDRFIAAAILSTPLLMPFFFDYDLLLLGVAAVLTGREMLAYVDTSRTATVLRAAGVVTFVWTMWNPALAELFGLNLTVPLLAVLVACQARRCLAYAAAETVVMEVPSIDEDISLFDEQRLAA